MHVVGPTLLVHGHGSHQIKFEQGQVHEVVLGQGLVLQVGVHAPEAFQTPSARPVFFDVGDNNLLVVANHDMGNPTLAVNQETNLAADFKRKLGKRLAELWRNNKGGRGSATVEIVQAADLVCLESTCLSVNLYSLIPI